MTSHLEHLILEMSLAAAILVGLVIAALGTWCALLEERAWSHRSAEAQVFGRMAFDVYRSFAFTGALTVIVSLVNLMIPVVLHEALPMSINWPLKGGAVFFLAVRLRWYLREHHTVGMP